MKQRLQPCSEAISLCVLLLCILLLPGTLVAQGVGPYIGEYYALHARGGISLNNYTADFHTFQGSKDCGLMEDGSGLGPSVSLSGELRLSELLHLGLGIAYVDRSGDLTAPSSFQMRDTLTGALETVRTEHTLAATLGYLELQPELRYTLIPEFIGGPLRLMGGLRLGVGLSGSFEQSEAIVSPAGATFDTENGRRSERAIASGDIETLSGLAFGISVGLENMLRVGKSTYLTQQIVYDHNLNDVTDDAAWKASGLRIEAGLRFAFGDFGGKPTPVREPEPMREPVISIAEPTKPKESEQILPEEPVPVPSAQLSIENVNAHIETGNELLALSSLSLVDAVFFERNSAEIPSRYSTKSDGSTAYDAMELHRRILPDIAVIARQNPKAEIVLRGATSGVEDENGGNELARRRAQAVADALVQLGVPRSIITVDAALLPRNPSNQDYPEGREENRRVDISVRNAPLQTYVSKTRFTRFKAQADVDVTMENFAAGQRLLLIAEPGGTMQEVAQSGRYTMSFDQRIDNEASPGLELYVGGKSPVLSGPVGSVHIINLSSVSRRQVELSFEDFEPILRFDYNSSTLSEANKEQLRQIVKILPDGARITVWGSTDALGSAERNQELSRQRATAVEAYIRSIADKRFTVEAKRGQAKFPQNSPEGRFLNRSIRIEVNKS